MANSHTEAEAKKLWCPMARVPTPTGAVVNRSNSVDTYRSTRCFASECAFWDWDMATVTPVASRPMLSQKEKIDMVRGRATGLEGKPERGYCGAAR